jgi:hypothetical protein
VIAKTVILMKGDRFLHTMKFSGFILPSSKKIWDAWHSSDDFLPVKKESSHNIPADCCQNAGGYIDYKKKCGKEILYFPAYNMN